MQAKSRSNGSLWPPFRALPAYLGGKRRLSPLIFSLLSSVVPRASWSNRTFIDAFLGAGSVSLRAKSLGFRVVCNDLALRSAAVGRAVIENSSTTLSLSDLLVLLSFGDRARVGRAEERYCPSVFSRGHARLLDRALNNLPRFEEPKRSLLTLLTIKWCLRIQPMSMLRGTDARHAFGGDLDAVSPRRVGHYLSSRQLLRKEAWLRLVAEVNSGVFPGSGEVHQEDVFRFLRHVTGDVVYLDPPYPGTTSYEREYAVLDDLLGDRVRPVSDFTRSKETLGRLFDACSHIPVLLISLNNTALSLEALSEMAAKHRRNIRSVEVPYGHLTSIASEVKNATNREFIVVAY